MRLALLFLMGFSICIPTPTSVAHGKECPFDDIGDSVTLAISIQSWDSMWESIHAPDLGNRILEGFQEDLLPAILKKAEEETDSASVEAKVEEILEEIDWRQLASSPISFLVWRDEYNLPVMTVKFDAEMERIDSVYQTLSSALRVLSGWIDDTQFRQENGQSIVSYSIDDLREDWIILEVRENSVWLCMSHTVDEALAGAGLKERKGFSDLWGRGPESIQNSLIVDFTSLFETASLIMGATDSEWSNSLVLDETMEALFKDDLETLEKLRKVETDMDFLTGRHDENDQAPMVGLLEKLGDLGLLVSMSGPTETGIESLTLLSIEGESDFAEIFDSPPLTQRFSSLVTPDLLRGSAYSIPDLGKAYDFLLEMIQEFPGGEDMLEAWKDIQESIDLHLADDLIPALGNEFAILTRRAKKASFAGFRLVNNESYVLIETGQEKGMEELLTKLEEFLRSYQLNPTHSLIGDVTFTQLAAGLMGEAGWGWDKESEILVITTTPQAEHLPVLIESLRTSQDFSFQEHPRWEDLQLVAIENPTALVYDDLSITWQQQVDELKGAKMMLSMMGGGDPITLGVVSLAMEILTGIPAPDAYLRMDSEEGNLKISHSILLFPEDDPDTEP